MDGFRFVIDFDIETGNVEDGEIDGHLRRIVGQDTQPRRRRVGPHFGPLPCGHRTRLVLSGSVEDRAGEAALLLHPPQHLLTAGVSRVQDAFAGIDEDFEIQLQIDAQFARILTARRVGIVGGWPILICAVRAARAAGSAESAESAGSAGWSCRGASRSGKLATALGVGGRRCQATHGRTAFDGRQEEFGRVAQ